MTSDMLNQMKKYKVQLLALKPSNQNGGTKIEFNVDEVNNGGQVIKVNLNKKKMNLKPNRGTVQLFSNYIFNIEHSIYLNTSSLNIIKTMLTKLKNIKKREFLV